MSIKKMLCFLALAAAALSVVVCSDDNQTPPAGDGSVDRPVTNTEGGTVNLEGGTQSDGAEVIDCTGKADGTNCAAAGQSGMICLKSSCVATSCGDGYVDTATGEECDDTTDGCKACKFACKADTDCADTETCNGSETCDTTAHTCKAGTNLADKTACTLAAGGSGECNGGVCAAAGCGNSTVNSGEECDDGNKIDGDGCNNNCKFSCHSDADCNDNDKCNGEETCKKETAKQTCAAGTKLNCDDGKACNTDSCDPTQGCLHVNLDADKDGHAASPCGDDCNDNDPAIFGGAHHECADGKDNDCDGSKDEAPVSPGKCWLDSDGDSYAATTATVINNCNCPAGYTSRDPSAAGQADCRESNKSVNPAQTAWFTTSYCPGKIVMGNCMGGTSFDYNCSGTEETRYGTALAATKCTAVKVLPGGVVKCLGAGWSTAAPACGKEAKYTECQLSGSTCLKKEVLRTQECH